MAIMGGISFPDISQDIEDAIKDPLTNRNLAVDSGNPLAGVDEVALLASTLVDIFETQLDTAGTGEFTKVVNHNLGLTGITPISSITVSGGLAGNWLGVYSYTTDQGIVLIDQIITAVDIDDFSPQLNLGATSGGNPGTSSLTANDVTFRVYNQNGAEGFHGTLCRMTLIKSAASTITNIP